MTPYKKSLSHAVTEYVHYRTPISGTVVDYETRGSSIIQAVAAKRADIKLLGTSSGGDEHIEKVAAQVEGIQIRSHNLLQDPAITADVAILYQILAHTPTDARSRILRKIRERTAAIILVERVVSADAETETMMSDVETRVRHQTSIRYDEAKGQPLTASWNEELLIEAGFHTTSRIWQWNNHIAWIGF